MSREGLRRNPATEKWVMLAGLLVSAVLELCLALFSAVHGYGRPGRSFELKPAQVFDYVQEGDSFLVSGPAPNLEFVVDGEIGNVRVIFAEALPAEMELYCYYTRRADQDFNPNMRVERFLMKGSRSAAISLPAGEYHMLRLDLRGDFSLDRIEAGRRVPVSQLPAGEILGQVKLSRLLLLALLLAGLAEYRGRWGIPAKRKRRREREGLSGKKNGHSSRTVYLDAARTMAAFFVIVVHVVEPVSLLQTPGTLRSGLFDGLVIFVLTCNLMFFFISGALLLPCREESVGAFYGKRMMKVALPFAVYSWFYLKLMCASEMGLIPWLGRAFLDLITGQVSMAPHFWMIYELLGVYLIAPFFRCMLEKMPERAEKWLFSLIVFSLAARTGGLYFGRSFGLRLFLDSWPGIFLAGYLLSRPWMRRWDPMIGLSGLASFAVSVWLSLARPDYKEIVCNCSLLMFCMTAALFVLLIRLEGFLRRFAGILAFFSRYSYSVLLIHWFVLSAVISNGFVPERITLRSSHQMAFTVAAVTVISFGIAFTVDHTAVPVLREAAARIGRKKRG